MTTDYLIVGAGIVGLSIARQLRRSFPNRSVLVIEKEESVGLHSSGRNSGVLHSGIYYPPETLKARVCAEGSREMAAFCEEHKLPLLRLGKILVPTAAEHAPQLETLYNRGIGNGIAVERLDAKRLRELEPEVRSATGDALLVRATSVGNPKAVIKALEAEVQAAGVQVRLGARLSRVDSGARRATVNDVQVSFGHFVNCAGLHADRVAHLFGVGKNYELLPFKGLYWKLDPAAKIHVSRLIYPVPDLRVPFLGVHTTSSTEGAVYLGPTAVPAFGRENYRGWQDVAPRELARITLRLATQFASGRDGFRRLAGQEGRRYFKRWFVEAAQALLPRLEAEHLLPCDKVGIRAQLFSRTTGRLVNDFVVECGPSSTHVLNAISPAWTSAFPFARFVVDSYIKE